MALWLVRTGKHGEHERRFLSDDKVFLCWDEFKHDLSKLPDKAALSALLRSARPEFSDSRNANYSGQLWPFIRKMKPGDWIIVPSKSKPVIHIAEIVGPYVFDAAADDPYFHSHSVKWVAQDVPRSVFDQDLLYSFGAFMTVCEIRRNDAEKRVRALAAKNWMRSSSVGPIIEPPSGGEDPDLIVEVDLARLARDQIAKLIIAKYKGHGLERLVDAILRAQGYTTFLSPPGPDKGIDILAAPGALGFGTPRICVQVKSGDSPVDSPTLNQLIGAMQNVKAEQGLLVSWGGFKSSVEKEEPAQFFRVRLWNQDKLIEELLANYDRLDESIRAELPLMRVWTIAGQEDDT